MIRKPTLRTYERKNNGKVNVSIYQKPTLNINTVEKKETKNKELFDDSLEDPFDSTFDRLLKEVKTHPLPSPKKGFSYISSSLGSIDDSASPKMLTPDSEEDSVFDFKQPSPEKITKLRKQTTKPKNFKKMVKNPSKLIKEQAGVEDSKKIKTRKFSKVNKRQHEHKQVKRSVKRKRRRISSSSEDSLTDFALVKKKSIPVSNCKEDSCVHSNSDLADFSFSQTPESIKSLPNISNDNESEFTKKVQKATSNVEKLEGKSNIFSTKKILRSKERLNYEDDLNSKTDYVISAKIKTHLSLKACSVVLKRCDWMLESKSCSVKIPRFKKKSETKVKISTSKENPEKETKYKVTKNVSVQKTGVRQSSIPGSANRTSKLIENIVLKDCFVNLTRIRSPKTSFSEKLFSSTPFVKKANRDVLSNKFRLMTMEMSNIETPSKSSSNSVPEMESKKASKPRVQLEDTISKNSNHKGNHTPKPLDFNSDIWNASSDYSAIDWTIDSLSDSQCVKPPSIREQQEKSVLANEISTNLSPIEDLELTSKPFDFVTKRNLRVPEYEKSASMFDDTYSSEKVCMSGELKIDQYSSKLSPLNFNSVVDSSVINQTEFKGFEGQTLEQMKKLSPMTAIPVSIVHSLTYEDSDKSFIVEGEKSKLIRSLALEKKLSEGKSPKKCLIFEEKPKIYLGEDSVNKESFDEKSSKYSISQSFKSDSFSEESLFEESNTSNSEKKLLNTLKLDDSTSNSSKSFENCEMKEESQKTPEIEEPNIEAVNTREMNRKESIVSLNCLKDPIRVTHQRKKYRNWGLELTAIKENDSRSSSVNAVEISPQVEEGKVDRISEDSPSLCDTISQASDISLSNDKKVGIPEQHLFLKPGKSWARSLSILNNIHSRDDVDRLSVGKGKKWRNSVINILDMQNKGIVQSCVRQQDGSKTPQKCGGALHGNSDYESRVERISTLGSISPNRFVKRISIRVVPDVNKLDGVEDTQFLEAYGISSNQAIKTLSQRFSCLENKHSFIEPQEVLVYNTQLENSVIKATDTSPLVTAKDVVLERCRQDDYLPFDECYPEKFLHNCRKIGEGVYGEVFLYDNGSDNSVIKIIPIEGNINVNGEPQKKFHEILSEIVIAKELNDLRFGEKYNTAGFVEVKSIKCIIGKYPSKLVELWKSYDDEKKSENDCPSIFDESQLYISLELGHGGQDLEAFVFQNASEAYAVFIQTAFALAVAEQSLEFEHRDLHWGNVLISKTRKSKVSYKLDDKEISFSSSGVKVAIIDFTLSRMSYQNCCIFNDLALDPALFTAEGEYQFEIYRLMRDKIENNWQKFEPFTNVLWLHYILDKMIHLVRYKKKTTKVHKTVIEQLKQLKDEILNYESAFDLVTKCDKFTRLYNNLNSSDLSTF